MRMNPLGDEDSHYRHCQYGQSARILIQVSADAVPCVSTVNLLDSARVAAAELAALVAGEDADEGVDGQVFLRLPITPKEGADERNRG